MNKTSFFKNPKNIALIATMFFVVDRVLKSLAVNNRLPGFDIGGFFRLAFIPNSFIAFSLPLSGWPLMILIWAIMLGLVSYIIYLILNKKSESLEVVLLTTILFGAISNYTDRINYGFVIDYLDLKSFTVFNLADAMICLGAAAIILKNLKHKKKYD
ncbi:MAG: signal peptidase II [Candidatus Falkowbacteria bacterium]|nr:signal peptidase II [Candidatus Falkowbacteria bacterium]